MLIKNLILGFYFLGIQPDYLLLKRHDNELII